MMEIDKGRPSGQALKEKMPFKGGLRSRVQDTWLGRNWSTVLILVAIILIALFVRSYFGYATAVDNGFLVGGGSDSYYHQRVIEYVQETGSHLVNDPLLNYPLGMRNARPPLFDWSVAVTGQLLSGVTGMDISSATGYALLSSTAIWGALTCIPVFMITRAAFGNRAGLLAALLLAIMPGHVQRSVFANADHDAMILFFVVFAFYFLLRALMSIRGTKWVENWKSASSVRQGIKSYLGMNHRSLIYALLGGVCVATVAMIWTGFTYVLVIILVYLLVQVLINRFRNVDSMGELMVVGVMLASAFAIMAPLYWQMDYWNQWFDVPFYLFLGSMVIGALFTVSRDYPWTLAIPMVVAFVAVALIAVFFISPNLFEAIISGQGYLVKSKLYSTISEAQAPGFSNLALSFGAVTFWLAIIGLVWAAVKVPKNPSPHFIFVVVWMGVSMYMAASAQRFMFNAAPAFAMAAGWILALIIAAIKFEEVSRALSGFRSNPLATLRKAFKLRHVAGALFLAFLIVAPNVWTAVDAGIPSETKRGLDKQIYDVMPSFLRPGNYNTATGSFWYLGAFTYSLPLPSTYWPTAWRWFSQQDSGVEEADRPAFLSWWDYGFEAIQQGKHPTVADNFQNGYQFAGSFITAGSEEDAVALMIIRLLEGTGVTDEIAAVMNSHGVDAGKVKEIMNNPSAYIDEVKNNPDVYGPYDNDLSAQNAKYAAARVELQDAGLEGLVDIYSKVREVSGKDIGYFAVDGRLFPFSASFNNIFYAPATLSDRVIDPYTNAPVDYYEIKAVTSTGLLKSVQDLTPRDMVLYYTIVYKDAFYKTMLYRAMMGYGPSDVGKNGQGIPGISGSLADMDPMPAWNLTHFKQVYRTAYYSPLNSTEAAQHPESWYAISYEEALQRQKDIEAGIDHGTVDLSASTLTSGVVFIQYYDGAILRGQATSSDGTPLSGIYVTAVDELGIPHHTVQTDEDGNYELILPFGDIKVVYSAGTLNKQTQVATIIHTEEYNVTYNQAMRKDPDYTFDGDIELDVSIVSGRVYWDNDGDNIYDPDVDEVMDNATVVLENPESGFRQEVATNATGEYRIIALRDEGSYIYGVLDGHSFLNRTISMNEYGDTRWDIPIRPSSISGTVEFESGGPAPSVDLSLKDEASGEARRVTTDESGQFEFDKLLPGNYTLGPADGNFTMDSQEFILDVGDVETVTLTLRDATRIIGSVTLGGEGQGNVTVSFLSEHRDEPITATTDENGEYEVTLPNGNYTAYVLTSSDGTDYVAMQHFEADGTLQTIDLDLEEAAVVSGKVKGNDAVSDAIVIFTASSGSSVRTTADENGEYKLFLLPGTYSICSAGSGMAFWDDIDIEGSGVYDLQLGEAASLKGTVYRDADGNRYPNSGEAIAGALLTVTTDAGRTISFLTDSSGKYDIILPKGSDYRLTISKSGYAAAERTLEGFAGKTENVDLVAFNQTARGTVEGSDNASLDGYEIVFEDAGGGASDATATISGDEFEVSLSPGNYRVIIETVEEGYRYVYNGTLTVPVGRAPADLEIIAQLEVKVEVELQVDEIGEGTIRFVEPDEGVDVEIDASEDSVYLVPGSYTIYALIKDGNTYYADLTFATVDTAIGGPVTITPEIANILQGEILDENGDALRGTSKVTIAAGANIELPVTTNSNGEYQVYLPDGTYTVSAEQAMKKVIDEVTRYVIYTGSETVNMAGTNDLDIPTTWDYDNVTVSGELDSSLTWLHFQALSETAIDANAVIAGNGYTVNLAPGTYAVYGTDNASRVVLTTITVGPSDDVTLDLTTVSGHRISGTVTFEGDPVEGAEVSFLGVAGFTITTDGSGGYSAVLPSGVYQIVAVSTVVGENNVRETRAASIERALSGTVDDADLALELQYIGYVELSWDRVVKEVKAGEQVEYEIEISNVGNVDDTYVISSTSPWGVTISESRVTLSSGESKTVTVTITTPSDAKVSHPQIIIKAESANTKASAILKLDVNITAVYGMEARPGPAQVDGTEFVSLPIVLENTGNADDRYTLIISDEAADALREQGWSVSIPGRSSLTKEVSVSAGKSATVSLRLEKIRDDADSNPTLTYEVTSEHMDDDFEGNVQIEQLKLGEVSLDTSGQGAKIGAPQVPAITWVLLALIAVLAAVLVILRVNKGVFGRRRKR